MTTIKQPFQCNLPPQLQETHRTTHTGTTTLCKHIEGTIRDRNDRSRNRRTDEVPYIAGCSHFTRKNTRFRAPASSPKHSPCNIHAAITMRFAASHSKPAPIYARGNIRWRQSSSHSNAICNQRFQNHIELRTQTQPLVAKHIEGTNSRMKRRQPQPPHTRGTFHRRLQPLYTEKHKVSCSGFLPNSPLAFVTASLPHHFPSSPLPIITTSFRHHFPSSPLPIVTTSQRHHLPSSTSLPHHFPSSPLPIVPASLPHHSPSSSLLFVTTSLPHHFPSSPLPIVTTSLRHHPVS